MSCRTYSLYLALISCITVAINTATPEQTSAEPKEKTMTQQTTPQPTGSLAFTTQSFEITDNTRQEPSDPSKKRKLILQCWIPQRPSSSAPQTPFPLILFSHGYLGVVPDDYSLILEDMASHGYLVAAITHTSFATTTTFADGRVIPMDEDRLKNWSFERMCADQTIWTADVQCVLSYLEHGVADSIHLLYGMYDSKKIGMCGHSFGGSTAFLMCLTDDRVKAGVNFDGALMCTQKASSLTKPFLFMWAETSLKLWENTDQEIATLTGYTPELINQFRGALENAYDTAAQPALSHITIPQFSHVDFTKNEMLKETPLPQDMIDALALIRTSVVDFFNKNL
ncbi:MAG: dienelactone hydrolase family protein [bacterium]